MKKFHRIAAAIACVAMIATAFSMPVHANEDQIGYAALAAHSSVSAMVVGDVESDTLSAVNDCLRWPDAPHNSSGPNPYAWTNYNAAQTYPEANSWLKFEFPGTTCVKQITIYYFVDSWSASLPKNVEFVFETSFMPIPYMVPYTEPVQITSTCWRQDYVFTSDVEAGSVQIIFTNADGQKQRNINKCVGVYEIEIDNGVGAPIIEPEPKEIEVIINQFAGVDAGSVEMTHNNGLDRARDGNPDTIWHSDWNGCAPEDMWYYMYLGKSLPKVTGLRYLPRSGNKSGDNNGRIAAYEVQIPTGRMEDGHFAGWKTVASGRWDDSEGWKEVRFDQPLVNNETLHIRLLATETYGVKRNTWVSAAEIELIASVPPLYF